MPRPRENPKVGFGLDLGEDGGRRHVLVAEDTSVALVPYLP